MKALIPVLHYWPVIGGLENWTQNIAERISQKSGVFVVTGKVVGQPAKETKNGVSVFRTSLFSLKDLSYSSPIYILSVLPFIFLSSLSLIRKEKIDMVHCQGFLSSFLGFCLSKITGIPYIVTVQRLEGQRNPLKNFIYRKAVVCIGASRAVAENFRKIGVKNIEIIPNGIDLVRFEGLNRQRSRQKLEASDEFVVMTAARLERVKGIDLLIEAMGKGKLPEVNCKLVIIGDGSERKNLEDLVKKLNLKERVRFLGQIPNEEVPEYLAGADCFILPSRKEGFGIALLEARAAGVPVIGSEVGGIIDIIDKPALEGEDGKIIDKTDYVPNGIYIRKNSTPESISEYIFWIYSRDKYTIQRMVEEAKKNLKEQYDWQNIAESVYKVYIKFMKPR